MKTKVLLDTDIGSDIDDAFALAYLLANPECELLGITTVGEGAELRAALASVLCRRAGKDVPIYPGAEQPLSGVPRPYPVPQAEALSRWDHREEFPRGETVAFMREVVRSNPGEVVLLTIGPLTNVALLFSVDPEVPSLLRALVMMCGSFFSSRSPEWNAGFDPWATSVVYRAGVSVHRSVGLDVTKRVRMEEGEVRRRRFAHPLMEPVLDFAGVWFRENREVTFHDPLAASTVFRADICAFERGTVEVELVSERLSGFTFWEPSPSGRHEVAVQVDVGGFFSHLLSLLG